jgi:hypothetical protein
VSRRALLLLALAMFMMGTLQAKTGSEVRNGETAQLAVPAAGNLVYLRYPSQGNILLLWIASERGLSQAERDTAQQLATHGIEVWMLDYSGNYFLDVDRKAFDKVPEKDMQAFMKAAADSKKQVVVYAIGRAAVPMLHAYGSWQAANGRPSRLDFILMHPNLYEEASALEDPQYMKLGNLKGAHLLVLQPEQSAAALWLDKQARSLREQGAKVVNRILKGVREGFWQREEPTKREERMTRKLADLLQDCIDRIVK